MIICQAVRESRLDVYFSMDLPMNRKAVYKYRMSFERGSLAQTLNEQKNARGLWVIKAGVLAHHHKVEQDVDAGDFMRVKRGNNSVWAGYFVTLLCDHLQKMSHFNDLRLLFWRHLTRRRYCLCQLFHLVPFLLVNPPWGLLVFTLLLSRHSNSHLRCFGDCFIFCVSNVSLLGVLQLLIVN